MEKEAKYIYYNINSILILKCVLKKEATANNGLVVADDIMISEIKLTA